LFDATARRIGRPASTLGRALGRNSDAAGHYHYTNAQQRRSAASTRSWTRNAPLLACVRPVRLVLWTRCLQRGRVDGLGRWPNRL